MFTELISKDLTDQLLSALPGEPDKTIQEAVTYFTEQNQTALAETIMNLTFGQIAAAFSTKKAKKSSKPTIPSVDGWKNDESVRVAYKASVLSLITSAGMGETRGLAPIEIRRALGSGSEAQAREVLKELEDESEVASTGLTKGKRFVPSSMLDQAEAVLAKEITERDVRKAEADARKAEADAARAAS